MLKEYGGMTLKGCRKQNPYYQEEDFLTGHIANRNAESIDISVSLVGTAPTVSPRALFEDKPV